MQLVPKSLGLILTAVFIFCSFSVMAETATTVNQPTVNQAASINPSAPINSTHATSATDNAHLYPNFVKVIDIAGPAVVNISTINYEAQSRKLVPDHLRDEIEGTPLMNVLRQVLGDDLEQAMGSGGTGLGSGVIVSPDGYIVTNYHVVQDSDEIYVRLSDRREMRAEIIGTDKGTDLALIKINATNLPAIKFAAKDKINVGEWVAAIGSPYGFEHTMTVGVISAKARSISSEQYVPFIQSDAAINPGNSGGPLLNLDAEMIGINSQIVSQSGEFAGLSFAVPSYVVEAVVSQLKSQGRVQRAWIGLAFQDITRDLALSFGLDKTEGALVTKVISDSPGSKAGVVQGDVIVKFNNEEIVHASDLPPIIGLLPVNTKATVTVIRDKKPVQLSLILEKAPPKRVVIASDKPSVTVSLQTQLGIKVRLVDEDDLKGFSNPVQGVYVEKLEGAHWLIANLRRGDIIEMFNNRPVKDPDTFYSLLSSAPKGQPISILIARPGEIERYTVVKLPR